MSRPPHQRKTQGQILRLIFYTMDQKEWTYSDLAARSGIDKSTISLVARGLRSPKLYQVECMLEALNLELYARRR